MVELERIIEAWRFTEERGLPAVLATVVKVAGSTYRRPGARMLFPASGEPVGLVSGGCLEADLAQRARTVLESGTVQTVVYDLRSPDDVVWGLGLGCAGEVRVLLERLSPGEARWLDFVGERVQRRCDVVIATVIDVGEASGVALGSRVTLSAEGPGPASVDGLAQRQLLSAARTALEDRRSTILGLESTGGGLAALVEYVPPAIALVVFGAGRDAGPLVRLARELGWRTTVADDRAADARPERFPQADAVMLVSYDRLDRDAPPVDRRTAVVVMTHHFLHDLELLGHLLTTEAPYVGLLGPRQRADKLLAELGRRGSAPAAERLLGLHAPVGLDIGSDAPEEIALSVVAEIQAVLGGRPGGFLRDRRSPLHAGLR